jgi:thioredoxin reductase (NADPH)
VLVVGGGDTAVEDALYLSELCSHVTIALRRNVFRAAAVRVKQLLGCQNITVRTSTQIEEILGEAHVEGVRFQSGETLPCAAVFVAVGTTPATEFLSGLPVRTEDGYIQADESGQTALPGLFAAGDTRTKPLRQIVTAVADGANAAVSAVSYLRARDEK